MYSNKQIYVHMDTIVPFVKQSRQVSEGGAISVLRHVNCQMCWYFKDRAPMKVVLLNGALALSKFSNDKTCLSCGICIIRMVTCLLLE